jgi:A/G-specific adenine glycosylase
MCNNYFWSKVIKWYHINKRDFPWRNTDDSFHVMIAEFLLQQTNVRKVVPVYKRIISNYSTPQELSRADIEELKEIISPLGLLYRAERLINSSKIIVDNFSGQMPSTKKELKSLTGVGDYIADAVLCYGFNKDTVPIDTNIIRLFSRFYNLKSENKRKRTDKKLMEKIENKYDISNYREANFAALDFSSDICTARNPQCRNCCLNKKCSYYIDRSEIDEQ